MGAADDVPFVVFRDKNVTVVYVQVVDVSKNETFGLGVIFYYFVNTFLFFTNFVKSESVVIKSTFG